MGKWTVQNGTERHKVDFSALKGARPITAMASEKAMSTRTTADATNSSWANKMLHTACFGFGGGYVCIVYCGQKETT